MNQALGGPRRLDVVGQSELIDVEDGIRGHKRRCHNHLWYGNTGNGEPSPPASARFP